MTKDEKRSFVPFYEEGVQIYMSLKVSKDGLSREEDTDVLKSMYDELGNRRSGWRVLKRVFDGEKDDGGQQPSP
jgi:hypothetical protein